MQPNGKKKSITLALGKLFPKSWRRLLFTVDKNRECDINGKCFQMQVCGAGFTVRQVKCCLGNLHFLQGCLVRVVLVTQFLILISCWRTPQGTTGGDSSLLFGVTHMEDPDEYCSSWLCPDTVLTIWGMIMCVEYLCLLSLRLSNKIKYLKQFCVWLIWQRM